MANKDFWRRTECGLRGFQGWTNKRGEHHAMPDLKTNADYSNYIRQRTAAWKVAKLAPTNAARA